MTKRQSEVEMTPAEAMREAAARVAEEHESVEFRAIDPREKLLAMKHVERIAAAIRALPVEDERLLAEITRLRKIAAHVPTRVWIKAKEAAGYATMVYPATTDRRAAGREE